MTKMTVDILAGDKMVVYKITVDKMLAAKKKCK
jgi:hypothetical protein